MASRGKTVSGTDGTDHSFRERIASQYKESAKLKRNFRVMFFLLLVPISLFLFHVLKINDTVKFTKQVLPPPEPWEWLYIASLLFNIIGYSSLSRNNIQRMNIYFYGTAFTVFGSVLWGGYAHAHDVEAFIMKGRVKAFLFGQPLVIITYLVLAIVTQLNIFSINYARSLLKAWQAKGYKSS